MPKLFILTFFFITAFTTLSFAQNQSLRTSGDLTFFSKSFLGLQNNFRSSNKSATKLNLSKSFNSTSAQLTLNFGEQDKFNLDNSFLQYSKGIATFGIGAVDRHWSFSKKTSLILSHNSRPIKSIYFKLKNKFSSDWLPSNSKWSLEFFNGFTEGSLNSKKSMLLGARAILSPTPNLKFEFVQTSQWGGAEYDTGLSAFGAALATDTNDESNSNINKMAGFGISYAIPLNKVQLQFYGQAIGEDEAGSLPSCYAYLVGSELSYSGIKYPTTIGIEAVDTRVKKTAHGYCGANTMYNNGIYNYTNYGKIMGAAISTEGTSLELFGQTNLSENVSLQYSTKIVVINDKDWSNHNLSSNRQTGSINSFSISWNKGDFNLTGNIYYQGVTLDKTHIKDGTGIGLSTSIKF
jgi:hypothetical protein